VAVQDFGSGSVKLLNALEILKQGLPESAPGREVFLASGFTPLHLQTFLAAHLRLYFPQDRIEIKTGLYGDLAGNLERLQPGGLCGICVVMEWSDLDPRLGIRNLGGWRSTDIFDIVKSARQQSERLYQAVERLSRNVPVCISMPTLPIPPIFITPMHQGHYHELQLREIVASLAASFSGNQDIKIVSSQRLDELSPPSHRFDAKSEISTGFPYRLEHASALAEVLAAIVRNPQPLKGVITDLDDTVWAGILGEVGVDGICWDMEGNAHLHGLYQQFLASLASAGVLVAAASKNDAGLVEQALSRKDILLPKDSLFPLEVHWGRKSDSVRRILDAWNIGPDAVVFVDDSPMEVAEVYAAFPQMECIVFPKDNCQAILDLMKRLRNYFGKSAVSMEDGLRLQSIRNMAATRESLQAPGVAADEFLKNAEASILFSLGTEGRDSRALELINKTNQFNLNGKRFSESEWMAHLNRPGAFVLTANYEDKYGALGKVSVLVGRANGNILTVDQWAMSCRAFSRRIEHQTLRFLFDKFYSEEIVFDYLATNRNGPLQEFLSELLQKPPNSIVKISNRAFSEKAPPLYHRVEDAPRYGV
jgi:FkbH-like protein